jgi:hypothetical protein
LPIAAGRLAGEERSRARNLVISASVSPHHKKSAIRAGKENHETGKSLRFTNLSVFFFLRLMIMKS